MKAPATHPKAEQAKRHSPPNVRRSEVSDIERRVLAHERILQTLIAHLSKGDPKILSSLKNSFCDPIRVSHNEHDYTDTESYAEQFLREVSRLGEDSNTPAASLHDNAPLQGAEPAVARPSSNGAVAFRVRRRTGIWEVTRDSKFYGDYHAEALALEAAGAAIRGIQAGGGTATLFRAPFAAESP